MALSTRSKKIRNRVLIPQRESRKRSFMKRLPLCIIITVTVLFLVIAWVIIKRTILSQQHTIRQVSFSQESVLVYDHPSIYKTIGLAFSWQNRYVINWFEKDTIESAIKKQFPIIKSLTLSRPSSSQLLIDVLFYEPTFVFVTPRQEFATFQEAIFDLITGNLLGDSSIHLLLPDYTAPYTTLDGIFYQVSEAELSSAIHTIRDTLGVSYVSTLEYIPWGSKLRITYKDKNVRFHLTKDINQQLARLIDLENNFGEFATLTTIDVGSSDDPIIDW